MNLVALAITIVIVSASGALAPGPLTVMTIALGSRLGWRAGLRVAFGHMLAELPYIILLALILDLSRPFLENKIVKTVLALITVSFMVFFAYMLIRDCIRLGKSTNQDLGTMPNTMAKAMNSLVVGIVFTIFNPYFLLWWATLGLELIKRSLELGFIMGILYLYTLHVWIDYVWLSFIAGVSRKGVKHLSLKGYRILLFTLALMLILLALNMLAKTFLNTVIIPM